MTNFLMFTQVERKSSNRFNASLSPCWEISIVLLTYQLFPYAICNSFPFPSVIPATEAAEEDAPLTECALKMDVSMPAASRRDFNQQAQS